MCHPVLHVSVQQTIIRRYVTEIKKKKKKVKIQKKLLVNKKKKKKKKISTQAVYIVGY
jgi:hypothetical protein